MKKFLSIVCIGAAALWACQQTGPDDGGVVVKQDVSVTIKPSGTMSGFTPYAASDFAATQKVQLRYLLYDASGKRVKDETATLSDFSEEKTVSYTLSGNENYTLVALAYYGGSSPAYKVSDTESLSSLTVTQTNEHKNNELNAVLGYAVASISPSGSAQTVSLQPATSLVYLQWKNIHSGKQQGGTATYPLYGNYKATATDFWGKNTYTWTITVEKGVSDKEVIIKNLCPYFAQQGWTADKDVNVFKGTYDAAAKTITLPMKQDTGLVYGDEKYSVQLTGGSLKDSYITYEDLVFSVGNGTLTTVNMMGTCCPDDTSDDAGWYELFNPGIAFTSTETPSGGQGEPDKYLIIYHNNDIMRFEGQKPVFSTSLGDVNNNSGSLTPANYTGNNIYTLVFLYPGEFDIFGRAYTEGKPNVDTRISKVNLAGNNQYVFSLECSDMSISSWKGTLSTKSDVLTPAFSTWKQPSGIYVPRVSRSLLSGKPSA